jgi:hypothetical protein
MIIGILNSIELYLKLTEAIESELEKSKKWYKLSADIFKVLGLSACNRDPDPKKLLDVFYNEYMVLFEESSLNRIYYGDRLLNVPRKLCFLISGQVCRHLLRRRRHLSIQMTAMCHRW